MVICSDSNESVLILAKTKQYPFYHLLEESMLPHEPLSHRSWRQWNLKDLTALFLQQDFASLNNISLINDYFLLAFKKR